MAGGRNIFSLNSKSSFIHGMSESGGLEGVSWSSKTVKDAHDKIQMGLEPKPSPFFFKNDNEWRKGKINFEYTKRELEELGRCANDILYFANNYTFLLSPEGYQKITPRKYQKKMLSAYEKERNVVVLSARQVGKCVTFNTKIKIKEKDTEKIISIGELYYKILKNFRKLSLLERIKYNLYKLL